MTSSEIEQLTREMTEAKLAEMIAGAETRSGDQPIKVMPFSSNPPTFASGYFTQQKYIWRKTPEEMEGILGVFGKFRVGAFVLQFEFKLSATDYENKAYSYLPDGKVYVPNPNEKVYLPATAPVPQWRLKVPVPAKLLASLRPGQIFDAQSLRS